MEATSTEGRNDNGDHPKDLPQQPQRAIPEARFWRDFLGISPAHGRSLRDVDPSYPAAMLVGINKRAIGEVDGALYQEELKRRALAERGKPAIAEHARKAAALSVESRKAKARAKAKASQPEAA